MYICVKIESKCFQHIDGQKAHEKMLNIGTSLVVQWLRLHLPLQRVQVQSLVGELRFPYALEPTNQNMKQKQYCNKLNRDFKNGPYQKIFKKKKKDAQYH